MAQNNETTTTTINGANGPATKRSKQHQQSKERNKRPRYTVKSTPWRDEWELENVGRALMSCIDVGTTQSDGTAMAGNTGTTTMESEISFESALDIVNVWRCRSNALDGLPHAIESTANLAQIYSRDVQSQFQRYQHRGSGSSMVSAMELRLSYSAAVIRCINGLADTLQQNRQMAAPISVLCGKLGIPSWLVEIRHEAAHNSLPTLPVLRLSATTLLQFLLNEYWMIVCPNWRNKESQINNGDEKVSGQPTSEAVQILMQYKKAWSTATTPGTTGESSTHAVGTEVCKTKKVDNEDESSMKEKNENNSEQKKKLAKQKQSTTKGGVKKTRILEKDPLFDDTDSDTDSDIIEGYSITPNIWGSSIGTNHNRFAVLQSSSSKSKSSKGKKEETAARTASASSSAAKKKRRQQRMMTKKMLESFSTQFINTITPQEGMPIVLKFLVWGESDSSGGSRDSAAAAGGGGGNDSSSFAIGRGALIPGSVTAFPTNEHGIYKVWKRYLPLIQELGRAWPGFCPTLLVHLIDFVLSIEETAIARHGSSTTTTTIDAGSVRKLFFLSSWIRLLLSERFIIHIDSTLLASSSSSLSTTNDGDKQSQNQIQHDRKSTMVQKQSRQARASNGTELSLAKWEHLKKLQYPLNSICDRLCAALDDNRDDNDKKKNEEIFRGTSKDVLESILKILDRHRVPNFGIANMATCPPPPPTSFQPTDQQSHASWDGTNAATATATINVNTSNVEGQEQAVEILTFQNCEDKTKDHAPVEGPLMNRPTTENEQIKVEAATAEKNSSLLVPITKDGDDNNDNHNNNTITNNSKMSLDEMEAMLNDDDDDDDDDDSNNVHDNIDNNNVEKMVVDDEEEEEMEEVPVVSVLTSSESNKAKQKRPAWIQCTSWDPCSIGTFPGYPA